jgi:pimeloyl-ACP methyl ester carboxylesterase
MPTFSTPDGSRLAYHVSGEGPTLVCIPGGPGRASFYLRDLGGLDRTRTLVRLDNRGTGDSDVPADPGAYRVDRLAEDVEALRRHLGLERMDLLGHSAGCNVATLYAAAYPERLSSLTLVTGLIRVAGLEPRGMDEAVAARAGEPWYADALEAGKALDDLPEDTDPVVVDELMARWDPFGYGQWDDAARAHAAGAKDEFSDAARAGFYGDYVKDPDGLARRLSAVDVPVLVIAGELDLVPTPAAAAAGAAFFPNGRLVTIPGSGHYPWIDNPAAFVAAFEAGVPQADEEATAP